MNQTTIEYAELRNIPRSEAMPFEYNEDVISRLCKYFPEFKDDIILADKEMREKRLFGDFNVIGENYLAAQVLYQSGVVKMFYLQKTVGASGKVISKISVMNKFVNFKTNKGKKKDEKSEVQGQGE